MEEPRLSASYESLFEQVDYLLKMGQRDEAFPIVERLYSRLSKLSDNVRRRRPELEDLRVVVTSVLASLKRENQELDDALALYEELIASTPETDHSDWLLAQATILVDKGDVSAGLDILRELAVKHPDDMQTWLTMASGLIRENLLDEAEATLKHAIKIEGAETEDMRMAYGLLFVVYKKQQNYDAAEKTWVSWMQRSDEAKDDTIPLFELFFDAQNYEKVEYWLKREKNPLLAAYYRAQLASRRDEPDAKKLWEKVTSFSPTEENRGWDMWAEAQLRSDGDPQKALEAIQESVMRRTVTMRGVLLMAISQLRLGHIDTAHKTLEDFVHGLEVDGMAEDEKLRHAHWQLFNELSGDAPTAEFEQYFATTPPEGEA